MTQLEAILSDLGRLPSAPVRAACQGVECSYSHLACETAFTQPAITFYPAFEDVFSAVAQGQAEFGVVPIENTLAGSVTDNYDLLLRHELSIIGSVTVPIAHCLLGVPGAKQEQLRHIYSHPQALHQCSDFLSAHRQIEAHSYSNTAASAQYVANLGDPATAAIGSLACAGRYGLCVLEEGLQNRKDNFTRFVIIARQPIRHPLCSRISLVIRVAHRAGSLYSALSRFAQQGINLLKLESRPIPDSPFEFLFYWDFDGNLLDPKVQQVIEDLQEDVIFLRYLGNYPEA